MARILYWNVNNFTDWKITNRGGAPPHDMEWDTGDLAAQRLGMILNTLKPVDLTTIRRANLDFIVVVEVYARNGGRPGGAGEGDILGATPARTGCIKLRREIANNLVGDWGLVPPIVTGSGGLREAIAVYYRWDRWYFLGPDRTFGYPNALEKLMPNRTIPAGYPYSGGLRERGSRGRYIFRDRQNNRLRFPNAANRKPWLTAFGRVTDPSILLRLMSFHSQPDTARGGTTQISRIVEMTNQAPVVPNQTDVIVGDFNIKNTDEANFTNGPYRKLVGSGTHPANPEYTALIRPPAGMDPDLNSYYHTLGKTAKEGAGSAEIDTLQPSFYPGLKYSESSVDNVFVRHHNGDPVAETATILARARRVPYDQQNPPVAGLLVGFYAEVTHMQKTIPELLANEDGDDINEEFRSTDNYGGVYSVSDHFAIVFDA